MDNVPESVTYVVIGAGIHGLSSAWHLAMELEARGRGSGRDIVVLDKSGVGAGAFTPDNVPIFDWVAPNVYMIADSNHGFKMTGVGKLLAGR
jgi:glycine/D-amino acid oxidase-like deaminating enzyme